MSNNTPPVISQIEWLRLNFSKYFLHILVVILGYFSYSYYEKYSTLKVHHDMEVSNLKDRLIDYQGCRTISPSGDRPLLITFSDNKVAYVNLFSLIEPTVESNYRSEEYLYTYSSRLLSALELLKSGTFSIMESVTIEFARKNRDKLETEITAAVNPKLKELEVVLERMELLEFCEPYSLKKI